MLIFYHVIDWFEYKAILSKMIELDVLDLELPTIMPFVTNFNLAKNMG